MIKRLRFADADSWRDGIDSVLDAPTGIRPVRVAASTAIALGDGATPPHLGVVEEWFDDPEHLHRFEARRRDGHGRSTVVSAEAVVLRGADWLERRWNDGPKFKHMALAIRADGLTAVEFSERWRDHAGQARAATGASTTIPDDIRGLAYVQDHPLRDDDPSPYDAVNEVYFDDLDGLRRRVDWFRDNAIGQAPDDLFGATSFLTVREDVVAGRRI